jgi:hypothetical protein
MRKICTVVYHEKAHRLQLTGIKIDRRRMPHRPDKANQNHLPLSTAKCPLHMRHLKRGVQFVVVLGTRLVTDKVPCSPNQIEVEEGNASSI